MRNIFILFFVILIYNGCGPISSDSASEDVVVESSDVYWTHIYWTTISDECRLNPELPQCRYEPLVRYPNRVLKGYVDIAPKTDLLNDMMVKKITLHSFSYEVSGDNCVIESKITDPDTMEFTDRTSQQLVMTINFKSECHASSLKVYAKKKIEYASGRIDDSLTQVLEFNIAESDGSPKIIPYTEDEKFKNIDNLALSISYVDTKYLDGKYTDRFKIKASDKRFDGSQIEFGVVSGLKRVSTKYAPNHLNQGYGVMYAYNNYNPGSETGRISKGQDRALFQNSTFPFFVGYGDSRNVRPGDTVIILPNSDGSRVDSHYLGGWIVDDFTWGDGTIDGNYSIPLKWNFWPSSNENITQADNLAFVIGTNERVNECTHDTTTVVAKAFNGDNELTNGAIYIEIEYEPYMVGKDIFIYANYRIEKEVDGITIKKHTGDAMRYTLKGKGINTLENITFTNPNPYEDTITKTVILTLDDTDYTQDDPNLGVQEDVDEYAQGVTISEPYLLSGDAIINFGRSDCWGRAEISTTLPPNGSATITLKGKSFAREYPYNENLP